MGAELGGLRGWMRLGRGAAVVAVVAGATLAPAPLAGASAPASPSSGPSARSAPKAAPSPAIRTQAAAGSALQQVSSPLSVDGPGGLDLTDAFRLSTGSPHVVVAYIEGGVNWHLHSATTELADSVYVNRRALPVPCEGATLATAVMRVNGRVRPCRTLLGSSASDYDLDGSGVINAAQWAKDPRVHDSNGNGVIDPEDLIAAFSCFDPHDETIGVASWPGGRLHCSNGAGVARVGGRRGFPHDISGWDFYDNQNDPATTDSAYGHSDGQMSLIHSICPGCLILPVKAGAEALDRTEDLANAWLYAAHEGAKVIVSVTADIGYSSYMRQVIERLHREGVVMVESSNDFDTPDHQGGMFWPHVLPGNGVVLNSTGLPPSQSGLVPDRWTRSDLTSWGPHNAVSVPTNGGSTSESTPTLGASIALLLSYGEKARAEGLIRHPLSGPRAEQVIERTARPVTDTGLPWPGSPGEWNPQYGYGIVDVYRAMQAVAADQVPPEASISSPRWYSMVDPTRTRRVPVTGRIEAPGRSFTWTLQAGLGPDPATWFGIGSGAGRRSFHGRLGTLDTSQIPKSFWSAKPALPAGKAQSSSMAYDVTLRLVVRSANGQTGEARRAVEAYHDPTWLAGFPMRIASSGESPPVLADLQGRGHLDVIFGTADGLVEAIDPATGRELPGWPARTAPVPVRERVPGVHPGHEPVISSVAVGSLEGDGRLQVVATDAAGNVYVFGAGGRLQRGWPKHLGAGLAAPPVPRPEEPNVRLPTAGALAAPVLYDLAGNGKLDIVQAGWDGEIHAWSPDGKAPRGWPVTVSFPAGLQLASGHTLEYDHKLEATPAIAFLDGPGGGPDVVERAQFTEITGPGIQTFPIGFAFAYSAQGKLLPGWPAQLPGLIEDYGSAQEFITEGSDSPVAADVLGNGTDQVATGPVWTPESLIGGSGQLLGTYGSSASALGSLAAIEADRGLAITGPLPPDVPVPFTTSAAFGDLGSRQILAQSETGTATFAGALLVPGSGLGVGNYEVAYPAAPATPPTGAAIGALAGFPSSRPGLDFLGEPIVSPVSGGACCVIDGGDGGLITAYDASGSQAPGFPKFTGGWTIASPSAGDLFGDGHQDLVALTREGYLFAWSTPGPAGASNDWGRWHHDAWNTGRMGQNTSPPGVARDARIEHTRTGPKLSFVAPGSRWYDGEATSYLVRFGARRGFSLRPSSGLLASGRGFELVRASAPSGARQVIELPGGATEVSVQAINASGIAGGVVAVPPGR